MTRRRICPSARRPVEVWLTIFGAASQLTFSSFPPPAGTGSRLTAAENRILPHLLAVRPLVDNTDVMFTGQQHFGSRMWHACRPCKRHRYSVCFVSIIVVIGEMSRKRGEASVD